MYVFFYIYLIDNVLQMWPLGKINVQYKAICNKENLHKSTIFCQRRLVKIAKGYESFAKFGYTVFNELFGLMQDLEGVRSEDLPRHTINTLQVYGQEKYLVLQVRKCSERCKRHNESFHPKI